MVSQTFTKQQRLLTGEQFAGLKGTKLSAGDNALLVLAKDQQQAQPRLGLAIAKKNAKLAVQRNRIKRIVRESFRHNAAKLPNVDIVVLARQHAKNLSNKDLRQCIEKLWKQLVKRANSSLSR